MTIDKTAIRNAATVIVLRDRLNDPHILMGQRGASAAFMPNKFVFPGGAVDAGDAVTYGKHGANFADFGFCAEIGDLVLDDLGDFCGADFHHLAFHRLREGIQTGADRAINALRSNCYDEAAQKIRIDIG